MVSMITTIKYSAIVASLILVLPSIAYADQGSISERAYQRLQIQMDAVTCHNNYVNGFFNDVVTVINNSTITSTLSDTDLPKLGTDFGALQTDVKGNNTTQFKTDVKTYNTDTKTSTHDAGIAIKNAHSKTVLSTLKTDLGQLESSYKSCYFGVRQQDAQLKEQMVNSRLSQEQKLSTRLSSHGMNTTALNQTINLANSNIQAFETAINNAQNSTQLQVAMDSFCLYNSCKDPNNFHFAAKTVIDTDQARLNLLATKNSTSSYQAIVSQAQADLNNAQTTLGQVGTNQYQGTQSSDIWKNIKAAADQIQQLQHILDHKH